MRCIRQKVCAFLMKFVFVQYLLWPSLQFSTACAIVLAGLLLFHCPSCSLSLSLSHLGFCLVLPGEALVWLLLLILPAGGALLGSRASAITPVFHLLILLQYLKTRLSLHSLPDCCCHPCGVKCPVRKAAGAYSLEPSSPPK